MLVRLALVLLALLTAALLLPEPIARAQPTEDPRFFPQTHYRIDNDRLWDFFQKRGGARTFGYPISGVFPLLGYQVQIFQRQVLQLGPDGSVATMNLLDDGLMPYTEINGSSFPAPERSLLKKAPDLDDPDYHRKALEFVKEHAPDVWEGQRVNFFGTFMSSVRFEDAFPDGKGDRNLMAGLNLEIWGLPTSRPMPDPTNGGFIYQRFQRGIMHYDAGCGCTQGLLLGQYFKAIITLRDLPSDLAHQARESRFFGQLKPGASGQVARPKELPGTDLAGAFPQDAAPSPPPLRPTDAPAAPEVRAPEPPTTAPRRSGRGPLVAVDAGHGGKEIGSSFRFPDGSLLVEKELTLKVALRLGKLLTDEGLEVIQTRTSDRMVNEPPRDLTGDDKVTLADELQARIDLANGANANLLVSVHFNGAPNPAARGTQIFYNDERPYTDRNRVLAQLIQANVVASLARAGYPTQDRRAATDSSILGEQGDFYLLGPRTEIIKRPSNMPAVIGEALYLTNESDANALRQDRILDALARGYADAVEQFFKRYPL